MAATEAPLGSRIKNAGAGRGEVTPSSHRRPPRMDTRIAAGLPLPHARGEAERGRRGSSKRGEGLAGARAGPVHVSAYYGTQRHAPSLPPLV
jgi:hypothetical protein